MTSTQDRVQVVIDVAARITAVLDDAGLSMMERFAALSVARSVVVLSRAPGAAAADAAPEGSTK